MHPTGSLVEFLTALDAFAHALAARPDVELRSYNRSPPAPPELLKQLRGRLPAELLELAALTNGFYLGWQFLKDKTSSYIQMPSLTAQTAFQPANEWDARLGADYWALRFDWGKTWLVVDTPQDLSSLRLVFTPPGDTPLQLMGSSLAHYLHQALAAGFVDNWPLAASHPAVQKAIEQIHTPPLVTIKPGVRVESGAFRHGRGEVLQTHTAALHGELEQRTLGSHNGIYALIRYDLGYTFWERTDYMKPLPKKPDLYETLRRDPWLLVRWGETEGWDAALRRMALMWGPVTASFSGYTDSAWLVAALLRPLSLNEGAALLRQVAAGVQVSGLDLQAPLLLPEAERPLARRRAADWRRRNWEQPAYEPLHILVSGYCARVLVEPEAGREELSLETLDELEAFPVWGLQRPFYHTRRLLVLNNDEHKMYFEEPSPELPGNYRIIRHSAY